jgi:hypothetical protein
MPIMAFHLLNNVIGNHLPVGGCINRADAPEEGRTDRVFDPSLEVLPAAIQMLVHLYLPLRCVPGNAC